MGSRKDLTNLRRLGRRRQTLPAQLDAQIASEVRRLQGKFSMAEMAEAVDLTRMSLYRLLDRHPTKRRKP